jgi:hypothetical protein
MNKKDTFFVYFILGFIAIILSTCDNSYYDGEITVTNGTRVPFWVAYQDFNNIDGIDVMNVVPNNKGFMYAHWIIRVRTYNSFVNLLSIQCNHTTSCIHDDLYIDENEIENLLLIYNEKYFETKNLIVTDVTMGVLTMNIKVNSISKDGVINITETAKRYFGAVISLGIPVTFATEIDRTYINPPTMTVSVR